MNTPPKIGGILAPVLVLSRDARDERPRAEIARGDGRQGRDPERTAR
jgi:hypothetical protein